MDSILAKKYKISLGIIFLVFILIRFFGINLPLHQDEYKWPMITNPLTTPPGGIPHPPLSEFIYRNAGRIIGFDNFRLVPLFFSVLNIFLIFYLLKLIEGPRTGIIVISLFALSFYSVLASLMVDVDGAIMPFFFLLMFWGYYKLRDQGYALERKNLIWLFLVVIGALGGFFIKLSGILPFFAIVFDFLIERQVFKDRKRLLKYFIYIFFILCLFAVLLVLSKFIFPYFRLDWAFKYWEHFFKLSGRGWLQTFIQFIKSIFYLSPLLILPIIFITKDIWVRLRPFFLFIIIGLIFYLFAFDFSTGALDRYFQFLIIPLCVITGTVLGSYIYNLAQLFRENKIFFLVSFIVLAVIFFLQFINHYVPPLYPKTEWINRVLSLRWNFLFPFTGGSGPLGFYISFLFMALIWIVLGVFALISFFKKEFRQRVVFLILIFGLLYNGVFIEEYLFGNINGSAPKLVKDVVEFIRENKNIRSIIVYNDNGGWNVRQTGKYQRRMYAVPQFENEYEKILNSFSGYILVVDIPQIASGSFYKKYLDSCVIIYDKQDKKISAKVYDCQKGD